MTPQLANGGGGSAHVKIWALATTLPCFLTFSSGSSWACGRGGLDSRDAQGRVHLLPESRAHPQPAALPREAELPGLC